MVCIDFYIEIKKKSKPYCHCLPSLTVCIVVFKQEIKASWVCFMHDTFSGNKTVTVHMCVICWFIVKENGLTFNVKNKTSF